MIVGHSERQVENVRTAHCERWSAASGYVVILFGIAGAALERGGPPLNAPVEETLAFFSKYRNELLSQSLMFVLSAGAYLWFFGSLRTFVQRAEGGPGMLSAIAFGAGVVTAGIQMVFQGFQVALAVASHRPVEPTGFPRALLAPQRRSQVRTPRARVEQPRVAPSVPPTRTLPRSHALMVPPV